MRCKAAQSDKLNCYGETYNMRTTRGAKKSEKWIIWHEGSKNRRLPVAEGRGKEATVAVNKTR